MLNLSTKSFFINLAEAAINGDLYNPPASSSNQPRYGDGYCLSCTNGTWPDPDGQRFEPIFH